MPVNNKQKSKPQRGSSKAIPKLRNGRGPEPVLKAGVPKGVQRSYEAFLAALPDLLRLPENQRLWAAFHGDEFVAVGKTETELYRTCEDLGFAPHSFYVGWIAPQTHHIEEIDPSLFEFEDLVPRVRK